MTHAETHDQIKRLIRQSWLLGLVCLPVILWQAWRLNHKVLRIPEAEGLSGHLGGPKPALKVLLIGESTSAGVGVSHNDDGLAGHFARALARRLNRSVHWQVIGQNGLTAEQTRKQSCRKVASNSADLVVIVHGFNDTVNWTSPRQWRNEIRGIADSLQTRLAHPQFVLTGIPPFNHFPLLPAPIRKVLSLRSHALELTSELLANDISNLSFIKLDALPGSDFYCMDAFHPSGKGYQLWGEKLTNEIRGKIFAAD